MLTCILIADPSASAQVSQEEHLKHHPELAEPQNESNTGQTSEDMPGMMEGSMGAMMDEMMKKMGAPKPKELYPSLMSLPDLPPEKREEVLHQAEGRIQAGTSLMSESLDELAHAATSEDYASMHAATQKLREGLAQFESGLAAKRAMIEGKSPRNLALQWFKKEMNLLPYTGGGEHRAFGGSTFHLTTITILGAFAAVMVWMYFFKMRRAAALLKQLSTNADLALESTVASSTLETKQAVSVESTDETKPVSPPVFPVMQSKTVPADKWTGPLQVCRIFEETPSVKTFRLAAENEVALPFTYYPGQFLTLMLQIGEKEVKRSYTIASTPTQLHFCEITVKREEDGLVSRYLHEEIREGDLLQATGPNGKFTFTGNSAESIVLIGGGVGITPLMSVVRYLMDIGWAKDVYLLYSCRTTRDFIFRGELERLQERHPNLHVFATMTRAAGTVWMGMKGRFTSEIIGHLVPEISSRRIHVCGPDSMMTAITEMLLNLNVPKEQVHTEGFGPPPKPRKTKAGPRVKTEIEVSSTTVSFKSSKITATLSEEQTVLDAADTAGVPIDNSCRFGQCGMCKVQLISGNVNMECDDALSDEEKRRLLILACQARARENIEVDA